MQIAEDILVSIRLKRDGEKVNLHAEWGAGSIFSGKAVSGDEWAGMQSGSGWLYGFIFINRFGNVQHQGTLNKALYRIKMVIVIVWHYCRWGKRMFYIKCCRFRNWGIQIKGHGEWIVTPYFLPARKVRHRRNGRIWYIDFHLVTPKRISGFLLPCWLHPLLFNWTVILFSVFAACFPVVYGLWQNLWH